MSRAILIGVLMVSACHHEQTRATAPPPVATTQPVPQSTQRHPLTHDCPTEVPGTTVNVDRFDGGIALVFTTLIGDVNDLRARVHHTAEQIERERTSASGESEPIATDAQAFSSIPTTATAIDIDAGARLELRPVSDQDLDRLRTAAEQRATQLASGQCARQEPAA